jgi:hypothetical protein
MKSFSIITSCLISLVGFMACKTTSKQKATTAVVAPATATNTTVEVSCVNGLTIDELYKENNKTFQWFASKARVNYVGPPQNIQVVAHIKIRRDSVIYFSIQKLGFEGARVLITPHTIQILNRLDKTYMKRDYAFLKTNYGIVLDFNDLQNLLMAQLPTSMNSPKTKWASTDQGCALEQNTGYLFCQMLLQDNKLTKYTNTQNNSTFEMFIENTNANVNFPDVRKINVNYQSQVNIKADLHFLSTNFVETEMIVFEVPQNYSVI